MSSAGKKPFAGSLVPFLSAQNGAKAVDFYKNSIGQAE
jgi:hypothetical protein